jgi:hypothetical protein
VLLTITIDQRVALIGLKVDMAEGVVAGLLDILAHIAARGHSETSGITSSETLVTSKGGQSGIALGSDTRVARLHAEHAVQLLKEAVRLVIQSLIVLPTPSVIRHQTRAEVQALIATRGSKAVAVLHTTVVLQRVRGVLTIH